MVLVSIVIWFWVDIPFQGYHPKAVIVSTFPAFVVFFSSLPQPDISPIFLSHTSLSFFRRERQKRF